MRSAVLFAMLALFTFGSSWAWAQKVNFDLGGYSITADPPSGSTSGGIKLSGFGAYSFSANFQLKQPLELGVGYTVFYSKVLTGDMGFGPDFYMVYFPMNEGSGLVIETPQVQYREIQQWRPFGQLSFHQRQFQSVQSSYSGFGVGLGTEWQWKEKTAFRGQVRTMTLSGPSTAKFTYIDFLFGLQLQF